MKKSFDRVSPEAVGIPCSAVNWLLDRLEEGWTEPHGLMLMRHGKLFAQGWWSPYAPGIRHGLQSHTKTYAATAVGIAVTEGLLRLDERVVDIFPEQAPAEISENLGRLTVRDVLCMGCGMEEMPMPGKDWIRDFLAVPVKHVPGTTYMYNSVGSTLLGAMVRQKTGLGLHDYLKPRLFDKIGIDSENLRWMCMPDGMEVGGGGLSATTEDNLRLMKLYLDGGVWEGERILSEEYVRLATTLQNESATEELVNPPAKDNFVGYGFQIWMCRPEGVYRADGAMGQFTVAVPDKDLLIAITENASGAHWAQKTLDTLWEFLEMIPDGDAPLPEDAAAAAALERRLDSLALPREAYAPDSPWRERVDGAAYRLEGALRIGDAMGAFMSGSALPAPVEAFRLKFEKTALCLRLRREGQETALSFGLDGRGLENLLDGARLLLSAAWVGEDTLLLRLRGLEGCFLQSLRLKFDGGGCTLTAEAGGFLSPGMEPVRATLL